MPSRSDRQPDEGHLGPTPSRTASSWSASSVGTSSRGTSGNRSRQVRAHFFVGGCHPRDERDPQRLHRGDDRRWDPRAGRRRLRFGATDHGYGMKQSPPPPRTGACFRMTSLWLTVRSNRSATRSPRTAASTSSSSVQGSPASRARSSLPSRPPRRRRRSEARRRGGDRPHDGEVSLLQGTKFSRLLRSRSQSSVAGPYLEANREGKEWLRRFCEDHGVGLAATRRLHPTPPRPRERARRAQRARRCRGSLGLDGGVARPPSTYPSRTTARRCSRTRPQFDPMAVLAPS